MAFAPELEHELAHAALGRRVVSRAQLKLRHEQTNVHAAPLADVASERGEHQVARDRGGSAHAGPTVPRWTRCGASGFAGCRQTSHSPPTRWQLTRPHHSHSSGTSRAGGN